MNETDTSFAPARLETDWLRTFIAVADSGSFSRAAERVHRSQSAVSQQIRQLEVQLGQQVFNRHARGVSLTRVGERLAPNARRIVGLLDETVGELRADPLRGSIRIGIPDEYGADILAPVVARFAREHPGVDISARCGFSADFPAALVRGELDLAVHAVESPRDGQRVLRREKTHWVTSAQHGAQLRDPLPVALFDRACWWRDRALDALAGAGKNFREIFSSESETGIAAAVAAGVAVGMLSHRSLRPDLRILTARDGFPALPDSVLVLEQHDGAPSPVLDAMRDAIEAAFRRTRNGVN